MPSNGWHRRNENTPAHRARRKQYNSLEYKRRKQAGQREVDAGNAHCWRCGRHIPPGTPWHLGHDDHDRTIIRGTECVRCNLSAAAKSGNAQRRYRPRATDLTW